MKPRFTASIFLAFLLLFVFVACNSKSKTGEATKTDTTTSKMEDNSMTGFDASMDATKTAGYPATILGDTLGIKAYEFLANPGDSIPLHSHPDHVIYVLQGGTATITAKDGAAQATEFKTGTCVVSGPQSHSAKNTGTTPLKLLIVHVYRPRG